MEINESTITKLEKLSNLKIANKEKMIEDLESVLNFMENIQNFEYNKSNQQINNENIFRDDVIIKNNTISTMKNINMEDNCFIVPKIIES